MPFSIRTGCFPATGSDKHINHIAHTDTPPEMRAWERIQAFFDNAQQSEALACIRTIYHPPTGTTREDVSNRFEQLRRLAHSGYQENIQSGRYENNHFCILDTNSHEMLSIIFDDTESYTLAYEGDRETHAIATTPPQTAESPPRL